MLAHTDLLRYLVRALLLALLWTPEGQAQDLEIRFLDVGQGDAVLVRNAGRAALIDTGPSGAVATRLQDLGVRSLDLLVASHNHADHIGGADAVLERLPVRFYLDNGYPASTAIQRRVLDLVERPGTQYLRASPRTISLGDAVLRIIPPPPDVGGDEQNNRSVAVLIERGTFKALLTGDSEYEELAALLRTADVPDVDVLKAAHHGSRNGVTPAWVARTKPEVVVISVGENNSYGHPHAAALRYYESGDRQVLRTDHAGDVIIAVDPHGCYEVRTSRGGSVSPPRAGASTPAQQTLPRPAVVPPTRTNAAPTCCRVCRKGKACGDSCIAQNRTCKKGRGCACDG